MAIGDKTIIASKDYVDSSLASFDTLPSQTDNSGKYLTTNGSTASWEELQVGATVVETTIAPNETKTIPTENTKTTGGLNVSIMEEDIGFSEIANTYSFLANSIDGFDDANYAISTTITLTDTTCTLSSGTWSADSVRRIIYEKNGTGKASINSVNGAVATIGIISSFSKATLLSGEWAESNMRIDNGKITLSHSNENLSVIVPSNIASTLSPNIAGGMTSDAIYKSDALGRVHVLYVASINSVSQLIYGVEQGGVYTETYNILSSAGRTIQSLCWNMVIDDDNNPHVCASMLDTIYKVYYGYLDMTGTWVIDNGVAALQTIESNGRPAMNKTTNGYIDIFTKESNAVYMYRKVAGSWVRSLTGFDYRLLSSKKHVFNNDVNGAFEFYSTDGSAVLYCGRFDGIATFTKGQITFPTENYLHDVAVIQNGTERELFIVGSYATTSVSIIRLLKSVVGNFFTTSLTQNTVVFGSSKATYPDNVITRIDHNGSFTTSAILKTKNNDIVCMFCDGTSKMNYLTKRVSNQWFTYENNNANYFLNPYSSGTLFEHPTEGVVFCTASSSGLKFSKMDSCENINFYDIPKNSSYDSKAVDGFISCVDNEGFVHAIFNNMTDSYNYSIPCYITNRTVDGTFSIDWNFTNQNTSATVQVPSAITVDENNNPYVVFSRYSTKALWKKVNGVWSSYASTGNLNMQTNITGDSSLTFKVYHDVSNNEMIEVLGFEYYAVSTYYHPAIYKWTNGLFSKTILTSAQSWSGSGFNYYTPVCVKSSKGVSVYSTIHDNKTIVIEKDGVYSTFVLTASTTMSSIPQNAVEDKDGNLYIFYVSHSVSTYTYYTLRVLKITPELVKTTYIINGISNIGTTYNISYSEHDDCIYFAGYAGASASTSLKDDPVILKLPLATLNIPEFTYSIGRRNTTRMFNFFYNKHKKCLEGFYDVYSTDVPIPNKFFYCSSGENLKEYKTNTYVHLSIPRVFTKYWTEITASVLSFNANGQVFSIRFSSDNKTFSVSKVGEATIRNIVSSDATVTGGSDGDWYYNDAVTYGIESWVASPSKDSALTSSLAIASNKMDANDFRTSTLLPLESELILNMTLFSGNSVYSPILTTLSLFYKSLSRWVNKTNEYDIYSDSVDAIYITSNQEETKKIKVVHNG